MEDLLDDEKKDVKEISKEEIKQLYEDASELMINQGKSAAETKEILISKGTDEVYAILIVAKVNEHLNPSSSHRSDADKQQAYKNMAFGALWCVGGIIASSMDMVVGTNRR